MALRRTLIILLFTLLFLPLAARDTTGNNQLRISLITCTGGNELYSIFGHSALRVIDYEKGQDLIFNFGLFDFGTPNFYLKFMQGKLKYMLGVQYTEDFMAQYRAEGRGVEEQVLNLTPDQKLEILERLFYLYEPQNRYYLYSFLFKNCTTELRDLLKERTQFPEGISSHSFREMINSSVKDMKWTKAGINLLLGSNLDKEISSFEGMFLPDSLFTGLALSSREGVPFVTETITLAPREDRSAVEKTPLLLSPEFLFALILLVVLLSLFLPSLGFADNIVLWVNALFGIVLPVIILMSDHVELQNNYNLLWCNPLYFALLLAKFFRFRKSALVLTAAALISLAAMTVVWITGLQGFELSFGLISASLAIALWRVFQKCCKR
ncbi:MAG: hypothetical protein CVT93_06345 [Bacteroidetes bacterium HGW-Bacteroidetes-10]|nr:MAG: hypothetical protein CVT93_06345 [Bacteroidetes bacterium HGW-Bacteroidetes-10]